MLEQILNLLILNLKKAGAISTKKLEDKYYEVWELYEHRLVLFNILCQIYYDLAWKSKQHSDGSMFNNDFIAGITTPYGEATYHFDSIFLMNLKYLKLKKLLFMINMEILMSFQELIAFLN